MNGREQRQLSTRNVALPKWSLMFVDIIVCADEGPFFHCHVGVGSCLVFSWASDRAVGVPL